MKRGNRHGSQAHKLKYLITRGFIMTAKGAKAHNINNITARGKEQPCPLYFTIVTQNKKSFRLYGTLQSLTNQGFTNIKPCQHSSQPSTPSA